MTQIVSIEASVFALFLPVGTLEWFDVIEGTSTDDGITLVLEEKNVPPLGPEHEGKRIRSKGFFDITITDFPIRGKRASLVFRRRRWKVENERISRLIPIKFPQTRFLKS